MKDKDGNDVTVVENRVTGEPSPMRHCKLLPVNKTTPAQNKTFNKQFKEDCRAAGLSTVQKLKEMLIPFEYNTRYFNYQPQLTKCCKITLPNSSHKHFIRKYLENQAFLRGQQEDTLRLFCDRCFHIPRDSTDYPNSDKGMEKVVMKQVLEARMEWKMPGEWKPEDKGYNVTPSVSPEDWPTDPDRLHQLKNQKVQCDLIVTHLWPHDCNCCKVKDSLVHGVRECYYHNWIDLTHQKISEIRAFGYGSREFDFDGVFQGLFDQFNNHLSSLNNPLEQSPPGKAITFGKNYPLDDRKYEPIPSKSWAEFISERDQVAACGCFLLLFMNRCNQTFMFGTDYPHIHWPRLDHPSHGKGLAKDKHLYRSPLLTATASLIFGGHNIDRSPDSLKRYTEDPDSYAEEQKNRPAIHQPWHQDFNNLDVEDPLTGKVHNQCTVSNNPKIPKNMQGSLLVMVPLLDKRDLMVMNADNKVSIEKGEFFFWDTSMKHAGATNKYEVGDTAKWHPAMHINIEHVHHPLSWDKSDLLVQYQYSVADDVKRELFPFYPPNYMDDLVREKLESLKLIAEYEMHETGGKTGRKQTKHRKLIQEFLATIEEEYPIRKASNEPKPPAKRGRK